MRELAAVAKPAVAILGEAEAYTRALSPSASHYSSPTVFCCKVPTCAPSKPKREMECRFFLDVVITEFPAILQLLARKHKALLVSRYVLPLPELSLDAVDSV